MSEVETVLKVLLLIYNIFFIPLAFLDIKEYRRKQKKANKVCKGQSKATQSSVRKFYHLFGIISRQAPSRYRCHGCQATVLKRPGTHPEPKCTYHKSQMKFTITYSSTTT